MSEVVSLDVPYASLEELGWGLRSQGVDLSFCQLDRGIRPCNLQVVHAQHCAVMRFDVGNRVHHLLPAVSGHHTFGLLASEQAPTCLGDTLFENNALLQVDPDRGLDATIEAGFSGFTFAVSERRLAETAALLGVRRESALQPHKGVTKPMPAAYLRHLRRRLPAMIRLALVAPDDAAVPAFFDEELPALLVRGWCIDAPPARTTTRLSTRSRAFQRATEAIRCQRTDIRTIEQLCRVSASSYSTLERAFRENTGITPKRYLSQARLSGVRRDMLRDGEQSITQLAHRWGFTHMSKFAADYRRLFGEAPSQTARPG